MTIPTDLSVFLFDSQENWQNWLASHYATSAGGWLKIGKKNQGVVTVSYAQALDVALCYGWIDGKKLSFDTQYFLQRFTPRRAKSLWSQVNIEKVNVLIDAGRMQAAGLREIESAKLDGRWQAAYSSSSKAEFPSDFLEALEENPNAKQRFFQLNKTEKYAIYFSLQTAKQQKTREARMQKHLAALTQGKGL